MRAWRVLFGLAGAIAVAALVYAVLPFHTDALRVATEHAESGQFGVAAVGGLSGSISCGPAIVDSWHAESTSLQVSASGNSIALGHCRSAAQDRLRVAAIALVFAGALAATAAWTRSRAARGANA